MVYLHTAIKLFNVTVVNVTGELLSVGEKRLSLLYMFDFLYSDSYNKFVTVQYLHSHAQKSIKNCLRQWDFCLLVHVFVRSAQ